MLHARPFHNSTTIAFSHTWSTCQQKPNLLSQHPSNSLLKEFLESATKKAIFCADAINALLNISRPKHTNNNLA
jgi:hypothetical protein